MSEHRILRPAWVDLGRVSLRYAVSGAPDPDTPPIVLLHEMAASMETWEPAIEILARDHHVIAYDWRGCGGSEKVVGSVSMDDHVEDLKALLDMLNLGRKPVIAGIAVGGAIASSFAAAYPDVIAGLIIICPAMGIAAESAPARLAYIKRLEEGGMRSVVDESLAGGYPEQFRVGREQKFAEFRARWISGDAASFAATFRMLMALDMPTVLARIACPTLAVAGEYDPNRTPEYVKGVAAMIPGAALKVVPGGHHMPHQIPSICAEFVSAFVASLNSRQKTETPTAQLGPTG
ncbi:alpha/beta hydrolase [Hoeflea sp. WL0058]|uniref:Alpha/beta hydrolase n=1 Tax=Flavimaribacter sediminis TaxID=2865987 RepID=A0AAE2ZHD8_9HYPH|nr:alpha/beta fold hydrolase [Flavimaribacter sediminis]MBW8636341.1 alpha/beta hydrolase [Flavimaribacter sediminis]